MQANDRYGYSEEVQEVIGTPATLLAKYGTLALLLLLVGLFCLAYFYTYPTYVTAEIELTSINPPQDLLAENEFDIDQILVTENDTVASGQTLLVALSRARFEHVLYLEDLLLANRGATTEEIAAVDIPPSLSLGRLQGTVDSFLQAQQEYQNISVRRLDNLTSRELDRRSRQRETDIRRLRRRTAPLEDRLARATDRLIREQQLARDGLENQTAIRSALIDREAAEAELQRHRATITAAVTDVNLFREQIERNRTGQASTAQQAADRLRARFEQLESAVLDWKEDYTIVTPIAGRVRFEPSLREGKHIFRRDLIATVIPGTAGDMVGRMSVDVNESAAIEEGQRVLVSFAGYDNLRYGSVPGVVASKGEIPRNRKLLVEVRFPEGLVTTKGYPMEQNPLIIGTGSILTEEQRLLSRLLDLD